MRKAKIHLSLLFIGFLVVSSNLFGQSKIILDKQSGGGYCNKYFDLGDHGFALVFNKNKDLEEGYGASATLQNNVFYYSKDLVKRANFKISTNGQFSLYASKNYLFVVDRLSTKYWVRVLNFNGQELASKKFDIGAIGLNYDLVSKIHFTALGKMIFEVYDGLEDLHIYQISLLETQESGLKEIDIPFPSSNPLENLKYQGKWKLTAENMGYYILARKGANSEYDPNAIAYQIAFYDEEFGLFRELLLDNILTENAQMIGKDASFSLNPTLQSFIVTCNIIKNGKVGFMVANYGMNANSNVMKLFWQKEFELINNVKYRIVELDGISVPAPPVIMNKGDQVIVCLNKGRSNVQEESINQMVVFDGQGNNTFNAIQMGNYEQLNLDGFCVDNDNLYSRIKKLQIATVLKPYCELQNIEVLDIDLDAMGNELAIVRNYDISKNQIIIYRFTKR
ncbi:MAG: hypothetical protein SGJ00_01115 [bacterium]|nr:hypothetical protein [bacterium]